MKNIKQQPKIVCLGAGTGQAAVLAGLKDYTENLTGIVNVTDNGGSSAQIRRSMNIPQPGDSRNVLVSSAKPQNLITRLFAYRFSEGELAGVSLGNYIIAALTRITGDFGKAVETAGSLLSIPGKVLPSTTKSTNICAELENGKKICGEWEIISRKDQAPIKRVFLEDRAYAYPECLKVIQKAQLIIIGPGSLFTGVIPNLLMIKMAQAIQSSRAKKVYICNMMTQPGLTDNFKVSDHICQIEKYLNSKVHYIIVNRGKIPKEVLEHYADQNSFPVENNMKKDKRIIGLDLVGRDRLKEAQKDIRIFKQQGQKNKDFAKMQGWTHWLRHDSQKLAKALIRLT